MDENHQDNAKSNLDPTVIIPVYQVIASRRLGYDTSMWQAPVLSFTAQSFLFTIALGVSNNVARLIAALLALVIALISMQLMSKHRHHEIIDSKLLESLEKEMELNKFVGCFPHDHPRHRARHVGVAPQWFVRLSSYQVWMSGLALFAIASISVIIITLTNPALLR